MKDIRSILALILATTGLLLIAQWFGLLVIYLMPIPFVVFGYQKGLKKGMWVTIVTSFFAIVLGDPSYYFLVLLGGTVGSIMGVMYQRKSILYSIVGGFLATLINFILLLIFIRMILQVDIVANMRNVMLGESAKLIEQMGLFQLQQEDYLSELIEIVSYTLPMMIVFVSTSVVFIVHFLSRVIFKRLKIEIPAFPPLKDWVMPKSIFYYYVVVSILMIIPSVMDLYVMKLILLNLFPILQFLLVVQGISFVLFFMNEKSWKKPVKLMTLIGLILLQLSSIFPILDFIGLFDLGFDIRKKFKIRG